MKIIGNTDIGCVRKVNQDYFTNRVISPKLAFSIVCDGMGGTGGGDIASKLATEYIENELSTQIDENTTKEKIGEILSSAIMGANNIVYKMSQENFDLSGMGTTVVACVIKDDMLYGIHEGDTRLYKLDTTKNEISQITTDHTVVQYLIEKGEITQEEAQNHPQKHYITRAIGVDEYIITDRFEIEFTRKDAILICTDGLYNYMSIDDMKRKILDSIQIGTVTPLIDFAKNNGGGDNITAVVITKQLLGGAY